MKYVHMTSEFVLTWLSVKYAFPRLSTAAITDTRGFMICAALELVNPA